MIPSTLHAREIMENLINEHKEALMRQSSLGSETNKNEVENSNLKTADPCFSTEVLRSKVSPQNAFSYTENFDISNKTKPPLYPKPKIRPKSFCEATENETSNLSQNLNPGMKTVSKSINTDKPCPIVPDSQRTPNNSAKNHLLEDYIKIEDDAVPPPLPSRPPPVFKYPLGMFGKETNELTNTKPTAKKEQQKLRKTLQIESNKTGQKAKDNSMNLVTERGQENIRLNDEILKTDVPLENRKNISPKPNLGSVSPKAIQQSEVVVKSPKSGELKTHIRQSHYPKNNPDVFQKQLFSATLGKQKCKPPKPLPRPELCVNKDRSLSTGSTLESFPKRSFSIPEEINNSQISLPNLELNRKLETKSFDSEVVDNKKIDIRPIVPTKPNNLFHQQLEHILVEQRLRECSISNSNYRLGKNNVELPKTDLSQPTNSTAASKPENFKYENMEVDSSPTAEVRTEENHSDLAQEQITDYSFLLSLDRPTLPQKMKSYQRSLSYNSLVQTVKEIGTTIWNPSEKLKRSSTPGMITKITEEKHSASSHTKDTKVTEDRRSAEEEKAAIMQNAWFHDISPTEAQKRLLKLDQDGAFLIRPTSRPTDNIQFTASITYARRVFNIHIRRKANNFYALGKEKEEEKSFRRLPDLVKYYQDIPFDIHPSGSSEPHAICFRVTPSR